MFLEIVGEKSRRCLYENINKIKAPTEVIWGKQDQVPQSFSFFFLFVLYANEREANPAGGLIEQEQQNIRSTLNASYPVGATDLSYGTSKTKSGKLTPGVLWLRLEANGDESTENNCLISDPQVGSRTHTKIARTGPYVSIQVAKQCSERNLVVNTAAVALAE